MTMTRRALLLFANLLLSPSPSLFLLHGSGGIHNKTYFVAIAQLTNNINGIHTVYAGNQYANCTGIFCFLGPNWGSNGKKERWNIYFFLTNCIVILSTNQYFWQYLSCSCTIHQDKFHGRSRWHLVNPRPPTIAAHALPTLSNTRIGINYGARAAADIPTITNLIVIDSSGDDCRICIPRHPMRCWQCC